MLNNTTVTIVGWIATDPIMRRTHGDTCVVNFRLASTERRFDADRGEWVDGEKLFVSVNAWGKLAENIEGSLRKGDRVVVGGKLYTRDFQSDGVNRTAVEVRAHVVGPDLSRGGVHLVRPNGQDLAA